MIIATLIGGLGNQMFQYAAGRALALRTGARLVLDLGWLENTQPHVTPRSYELGCFQIQAELRSIYPRTNIERLRELVRLSPRIWREQRMYGFDPRTLELPGRVRLIGYWPSERYFADQADQLREDFRFVEPLDDRSREVAGEIEATNSVSVHVRRGDYVENPATEAFHGVLSAEYYRAATERIFESIASPHFFVFSDDPAWCHTNLALGGSTTYVDHNGARGSADLRLMSLCAHHIVANSSFSWWGAWLNPRADKLVVLPKRWITSATIDTSAVVPDGWVAI
jgi:hypothetical protein